MTLPISTLKSALFGWIQPASGIAAGNVIFAHQNGPEPTGAHIVINPITGIQRIGMTDEWAWSGGDEEYTIYHRRRVSGSIHCYGPNAMGILSAVQDALELPATKATLDAVPITIWTGEIRNLSGLRGQALWEERAQMDFTALLSTSNTDSTSGTFNAVEYSSDADQLDLPETTISA